MNECNYWLYRWRLKEETIIVILTTIPIKKNKSKSNIFVYKLIMQGGFL